MARSLGHPSFSHPTGARGVVGGAEPLEDPIP